VSATTKEELVAVEGLIDSLRKRGVRSFQGFGVALELFPDGRSGWTEAAPKATDMETTLKELASPAPLCRCGHEEFAHNAGMCLAGCPAEACAPREKP
jgi:hypothetical protein